MTILELQNSDNFITWMDTSTYHDWHAEWKHCKMAFKFFVIPAYFVKLQSRHICLSECLSFQTFFFLPNVCPSKHLSFQASVLLNVCPLICPSGCLALYISFLSYFLLGFFLALVKPIETLARHKLADIDDGKLILTEKQYRSNHEKIFEIKCFSGEWEWKKEAKREQQIFNQN